MPQFEISEHIVHFQTDAEFKCGDDGGSLQRTFGASALHSHSGGGFGSGFGGFDKEVIYDPICDEWRAVTMHECPIAFNFPLYEPLCK